MTQGKPQLGQAYQRVLPASHRVALYDAAAILTDDMIDALVAIRAGEWTDPVVRLQRLDDSTVMSNLPPRYCPQYTVTFVRRFYAALMTVIWKLGQRERIRLSCVAEELAAYLLIQAAEMCLEMDDVTPNFDDFEDTLFEDSDFEFLYEDAYDGIEETEVADEIGIAHLAFAEWFTRFGDTPGTPSRGGYYEPHPLCAESEEPANQEEDTQP